MEIVEKNPVQNENVSLIFGGKKYSFKQIFEIFIFDFFPIFVEKSVLDFMFSSLFCGKKKSS